MNPQLKKARSGDRSALARLVSLVEESPHEARGLVEEILPSLGHAHIIGITGPPGAGKSTLTNRLIKEFRAKRETVAVLAVDPSSPFTGGAVLGDRIRMNEHSGDPGVFIRSLGTRGQGGGLSASTQRAVFIFDACGFDRILIETAGVGQTELQISRLAQTVVVVLVPESGDEVQVLKAGILEIAHVFCLNKSDRPESDLLYRELRESFPPHIDVVKSVATTGSGLADLVAALDRQKAASREEHRMLAWRERVLTDEVMAFLSERMHEIVVAYRATGAGKKAFSSLATGSLTPYDIGKRLIRLKK